MPNTPSQLLESLRWRYATKKFDPTASIPAESWDALLQSLVLTPSSFGLQPWKFIIVENPTLRAALREASWGQPQVTDASHYIVLATRTSLSSQDVTDWMETLAATQGTTAENLAPLHSVIAGFIAPMTDETRRAWNTRQVYIALGQLMTAAAFLGIDSCPMEGIDPAAYDRILGLEGSGYATAVGCALGHRASDDKYAAQPKARFPASRVITTLA
jgi:nitroreductase